MLRTLRIRSTWRAGSIPSNEGSGQVKKRVIIFAALSAASLVLSAISLITWIISLSPQYEFLIFSVLTAVLGILGLVNSFGKGKAALGCLVTAAVASAGSAVISLIYCFIYSDGMYIIALIYFCLYAAGAVVKYPKNLYK